QEVARRFVAAWEEGDVDRLAERVAAGSPVCGARGGQAPAHPRPPLGRRAGRPAADATVEGAGGGKPPAIPQPLVGAERVAKALAGWARRGGEYGLLHRPAIVNGDPGLVFHDADGRIFWVAALEIADGVVVALRSILNPDKLAHLSSGTATAS